MSAHDWSKPQKAGQKLMVGFDGLELSDQLKFYIKELKVGGLMLFARNIASPHQVRSLCAESQAFAATCGQPPLLIGIDQEGGAVSRLKPPFTQFSGNPSMTNVAKAQAFALITARELNQIGVNINMAPVLDLAAPQGPSIMRSRVFGQDPHWVARMGAAVIDQLQANGILAVGKHFPGIGRTVLDSHEDLPDLDIDVRTLMESDLIPFQAAIEAKVAGIMVSHIRYRQLDPHWPASLSVQISRDLLRGRMGYRGLVLTDDIDMGAVAKHYSLPQIIAQCLEAQIDLILICHPGPKIAQAADLIIGHLNHDSPSDHNAMERLIAIKQSLLAKTPV